MKISVVIPLYNKVRHIRRAVESVLAQTRQDFELLVVDDGSTDGSGDVVGEIIDSRIRLIAQPNAGECAARNRGIEEAIGELIAFLDADDEWLPGFLETVLRLYSRFPKCGIYATAYNMAECGKINEINFCGCPQLAEGGILKDYFKSALAASPVTSSSAMIPKKVLREVGGFPAGVRRAGDIATWVQIALRHPIAWSPVKGATYHLSADNRACHLQAVPDDLPGAVRVEEYLTSGQPTFSPRQNILEYLVFMRLRLARHACLTGQRKVVNDLLRKTKGTVLYGHQRRVLLCLSALPSPLLQAAVQCKNTLTTVMSG